MCTRGAACAFAHGEHELKQVPDLTRTKPCPTLLRTGVCNEPQCAFAHQKEEIRRFPANSYSNRVSGAADGHERMANSRSMYTADPLQCERQVVEQDTRPKMEPKAAAWMPHYQPLPPPSPSMLLLPTRLPYMQLPATSAMCPENNVALERHEHEPFAPSPGPRTSKFQKTKLCRAFFATGRCVQRGRCNFAHCEEELCPLPNLSRTKLCPKLVTSESCNDPGCTFAHSPEQILQWHDSKSGLNPGNAVMLDAEQEEKGGAPQVVMLYKREYEAEDEDTEDPNPEEDLGSCDLMSESDLFNRQLSVDLNLDTGFQRQHTEDPVALRVRQLRVKNTFITIDEDESSQVGEKPPRRRRARSAPVLKADTTPIFKPALEFPQPAKTLLMTAQAADAGTEGPLFPASEVASANSILDNDLGLMLPRLPRPSPPPRRFHRVERSSGPALSTPSLVTSACLSQAGDFAGVILNADVPAHALAPFKHSPVRIDSGLGDWPLSQSLPYYAQEPQYLGEPHFVQSRWSQI